MVLFHLSDYSTPCHPWSTYRWIPYYSSFHLDQVQYQYNSALALGKVGCQVGWVALLVAWLEVLVLTVDMAGVVKSIQETWDFGLQAMLEGSLGVSGPHKLHISCVTLSNLALDSSVWQGCFSNWIPLPTLYEPFLFGFHSHPPFYSHNSLLCFNTWGIIFLDNITTTPGLDWLDNILQLICNITIFQR